MAISIDWATYTINIPRADMLLIQSTPIEIRQLDLTTFHETLRDLEDDPAGMPQPTTHNYKAPLSISGVVLAQVVEILSPYTITFEDGQYAVNIVGGNSNIADKVNINNVGVRTANSAGLQDLTSLQAASFGGQVTVDMTSQYSGTIFPVGTRGYPVNNLADAQLIADERGIKEFNIVGPLTISSGTYVDSYVFRGDNPNGTIITLEANADISNAIFYNSTITGVLDNGNVIRECVVNNLTHINGVIYESAIAGDIILGDGTTCILGSCFAGTASETDGIMPKIVWPSGVTCDLVVSQYSGNLSLSGSDVATNRAQVELVGGHVFIKSDLVAGDVAIYGHALIQYEGGHTADVEDETVHEQLRVVNAGVKKSSLIVPHTTDLL